MKEREVICESVSYHGYDPGRFYMHGRWIVPGDMSPVLVDANEVAALREAVEVLEDQFQALASKLIQKDATGRYVVEFEDAEEVKALRDAVEVLGDMNERLRDVNATLNRCNSNQYRMLNRISAELKNVRDFE